jgi:LmbE family N-acetylglucosaminyl deacetylase
MKTFPLLRDWVYHCNTHLRIWWHGFALYLRYFGDARLRLLLKFEKDYFIKRRIITKSWQPKQVSLPVGKRILSISPHSDDESIGAGGLLWAHRNLSEIHCIVLSRGERGGALEENIEDQRLYSSKLADIRKAEFSKTASMLNAASKYFFDFPDGNILCNMHESERLRSLVKKIEPDVVLLPWFLDDLPDHRRANILYAWACAGFALKVFSYEVWTTLEPNAVLDITDYLDGKLQLVRNYESQLRTVDYLSYVSGLSKMRAFQFSGRPCRSGAIEAYLALSNHEYCDLVFNYYGKPGKINKSVYALIGM